MTTVAATLELAFLGPPELRLLGRAVTLPTRKSLALLVFLAHEPGLHQREKLAAMFWPDNDETGGRTALRKALGFLNAALEVDGFAALNVSRDALGFNLGADVHSDVLSLEAAAKRARTSQGPDGGLQSLLEAVVDAVRGEFMAGFLLPEAMDFEDWLEVRREGLRRDVDTVLHRLSSLQAYAGHVEAALGTARKRVVLDTLNEAAHRAVIELHLRTGDRAAALGAFRQCQAVLEKELGIVPALETQALAGLALAGERQALPLVPEVKDADRAISRPVARASADTALFVGRQREWDMLEDAWNGDLIAFVSGEPGAGKSRLMQEFMREKGMFVALENRPGDAGVPYASLARHLRALLKSQAVTLEAWVSTELSRILPELGAEAPPIQSEQGKLRFLQAIAGAFETVIRTNANLTALVYDDAQFTDSSSAEAIGFVLEQLEREDRARLRIFYGYRKNEITPELEVRVKQTLLAGEGVLIELEPLPVSALEVLLHSLLVNIQPEDMAGISRTLEQFTGGNPLFVLETVKSLTESQHGEQWTAVDLETMRSENRLPKSSKVKQVIERRLERLSKPARDLVRVAAVMGQEYTLERAARVLEADGLVLAEASDELEVVGIVRANRFTHDLLFEASLEGVSKAAKPLLHSRVLDVFEGSVLNASILLRHAIESERQSAVFRYSREAAIEASRFGAYESQVLHLERARQVYLVVPNQMRDDGEMNSYNVLEVYHRLIKAFSWLNDFDSAATVVDELIRVANETNNHHFLIAAVLILTDKSVTLPVLSDEKAKELLKKACLIAYQFEIHDLLSLILSQFQYWNLEEVPDYLTDPECRDYFEYSIKYAKVFLASGQKSRTYTINCYFPSDILIEKLISKAVLEFGKNNFEESERYFSECNQVIESSSFWNTAYFNAMYSRLKVSKGELETASKLALEGVLLAKKQWDLQLIVYAHEPAWNCKAEAGLYAELIQEARENTHISNKILKLICQRNLGLSFLLLGQFELAHDQFLATVDVVGQLETFLCAQSLYANELDDALKYAIIACERNLPHVGEVWQTYFWHLETETLLRFDHVDLARADIHAREPHVTKWLRYLLPHLRSEAVLHRFENHLDTALEKLQQALEIAQTIGLPREIWEITSDIARLLERQGHTNLAREARSRAVAVRDSLVVNVPEDMRARYLEFTDGQIHATLFLGEQ
jgi:DNA-binding SARP family transcriptional activator/tetratricopeptide (TPR) repeat protein